MANAIADRPTGGRPLTGRTVLIITLAFFGTVFAVNAVMVRAALSTFGGVETTSSYKAGLAFKQELAAAHAQADRHWRVEARVVPAADGRTSVVVEARDATGERLRGVTAQARLAHPTDSRRDHAVALTEDAPGDFRGATGGVAGNWDLVIDIFRGDERLFRSKSRVYLR